MKLRKITPNSKKGQFDLIVMMIVFFIFVVAAGLVYFVMSTLNSEVESIPELEGFTEPIELASGTLNMLNWGPTLIFVAMIISLMISFFKIGSAPYWFIIHLIVIVLCVILAGILGNIYYDISLDPDIGPVLINNLTYPTAIMNRLPIIMAVVGFISVIILVTKWAKDGDSSGSLPGF